MLESRKAKPKVAVSPGKGYHHWSSAGSWSSMIPVPADSKASVFLPIPSLRILSLTFPSFPFLSLLFPSVPISSLPLLLLIFVLLLLLLLLVLFLLLLLATNRSGWHSYQTCHPRLRTRRRRSAADLNRHPSSSFCSRRKRGTPHDCLRQKARRGHHHECLSQNSQQLCRWLTIPACRLSHHCFHLCSLALLSQALRRRRLANLRKSRRVVFAQSPSWRAERPVCRNN